MKTPNSQCAKRFFVVLGGSGGGWAYIYIYTYIILVRYPSTAAEALFLALSLLRRASVFPVLWLHLNRRLAMKFGGTNKQQILLEIYDIYIYYIYIYVLIYIYILNNVLIYEQYIYIYVYIYTWYIYIYIYINIYIYICKHAYYMFFCQLSVFEKEQFQHVFTCFNNHWHRSISANINWTLCGSSFPWFR